LSILADLRLSRAAPLLEDPRLRRVIEGLRRDNFLEGTVLEARSRAMGMDPYSILLGILIGAAATMIVGAVTVELWLPRVISRLTRKTLEETSREVGKWLAGSPVGGVIT